VRLLPRTRAHRHTTRSSASSTTTTLSAAASHHWQWCGAPGVPLVERATAVPMDVPVAASRRAEEYRSAAAVAAASPPSSSKRECREDRIVQEGPQEAAGATSTSPLQPSSGGRKGTGRRSKDSSQGRHTQDTFSISFSLLLSSFPLLFSSLLFFSACLCSQLGRPWGTEPTKSRRRLASVAQSRAEQGRGGEGRGGDARRNRGRRRERGDGDSRAALTQRAPTGPSAPRSHPASFHAAPAARTPHERASSAPGRRRAVLAVRTTASMCAVVVPRVCRCTAA
jgi:hypothetical protein